MIKDTKLSALKLGGDGGPSCQSFTLRKKAGQHHYHKGLPLLSRVCHIAKSVGSPFHFFAVSCFVLWDEK